MTTIYISNTLGDKCVINIGGREKLITATHHQAIDYCTKLSSFDNKYGEKALMERVFSELPISSDQYWALVDMVDRLQSDFDAHIDLQRRFERKTDDTLSAHGKRLPRAITWP